MDFFINKNSNLPELLMELVKDNHNDYEAFNEKLQGATITFTMREDDTDMIKVPYQNAFCFKAEDGNYGIGYKFKDGELNKKGVYNGQFIIKFVETSETLIVPIKEQLKIYVQ